MKRSATRIAHDALEVVFKGKNGQDALTLRPTSLEHNPQALTAEVFPHHRLDLTIFPLAP